MFVFVYIARIWEIANANGSRETRNSREHNAECCVWITEDEDREYE